MGTTQNHKSIALNNDTISRLDQLKHKGQTYNGVISELLDELEKVYAARKKEPNNVNVLLP